MASSHRKRFSFPLLRSKWAALWLAFVGLIAAVLAVPLVAQAAGGRQVCVKNGTGSVYLLATCPAGFWTASLGGTSGPAGPAGPAGPQGPIGPKGDSGNNSVTLKTVALTLTNSSPATQTVTVTGLPAYSSGVPQVFGSNSADAPAGTTVIVSPVVATPSTGSTERSFTVQVSGFTGTKTLHLTIWVLTITP